MVEGIFSNFNTQDSTVADFLARKKLTWSYGTEKAAWANGFFKRCVQMVKRPLRKILGTHALSFRELLATGLKSSV